MWSIAKNQPEVVLDVYVSYRSPAYALADGGLYYGTRKDGPYEIHRWDFSKHTDAVADPAARNIHFIDLFGSIKGRFVAEGDFEEQKDGIRIYDIQRNHTFRTFGKNETFVGWDSLHNLFFTTNEKSTQAWDPEDGVMMGTIDALKGYKMERVEVSSDGSIILAIWETSEGINTPTRSHLTVLSTHK
mgnify:FL=1